VKRNGKQEENVTTVLLTTKHCFHKYWMVLNSQT